MEWSIDKTFEFLQLFQMEPCLWDPRVAAYKNRSTHRDAWQRIVQSLSFQVTIEELKKKKDSLMGYYRIHLNKYNKSLKTGAGKNYVYMTTWFAFDLMDSFLRPIYVKKLTKNTESNSTTSEENCSDEAINESIAEKQASTEHYSNNARKSTTNSSKMKKFKRKHPIMKVEKEVNETFNCSKAIANRKEEKLDEYDHFAYMIAYKIRRIQSADDRETLMNSIQNLTYEFYMKNKERNSPVQSMVQLRSTLKRRHSSTSSTCLSHNDADTDSDS